jgi:hypothetical protein
MAVYQATASFRDDKGYITGMRWRHSNALISGAESAAAALLTLVEACTNAAFARGGGVLTAAGVFGTFGTDAEYESCSDKALLTFQTPNGEKLRMTIPAPKDTIFTADGISVDGADTAVAALIAAATDGTDGICSLAGNIAATYLGGHRLKRRAKRLSSNLLSSALT